jgi:hypothetical protein
LLDPGAGKESFGRVSLHAFEAREHIIAQEIEFLVHEAAFDRIVDENAVEPLHLLKLLSPLGIHRQRQIRASIETLVRFLVAHAAKRDPIAGLELRRLKKGFAADVVRGEVSPRMAVHAAMPVTLPDEIAPSSQASLPRQAIG